MVRHIAIGALGGLAWSCGLRGFMVEVVAGPSTVSWSGTFLWVLAPGVLAGALLGWADHVRRTSADPRARWLVWSPFAFSSVVVADLVVNGSTLQGGVGGSSLGTPAIVVLGAHALAGRRRWARVVSGVLALGAVPAWAFTATIVGGPRLGLDRPDGVLAALTFWSLLAVASLATAVPLRIPHRIAGRAPTPGGTRVRSQVGPR